MLNTIRYKRNLILNGSAKSFFACLNNVYFRLPSSDICALDVIRLSARPTLYKNNKVGHENN